jgi:hypothetical protein
LVFKLSSGKVERQDKILKIVLILPRLPNLSSLPNEILFVFISSGLKVYPACPVKRGACLSGVKSLLHLFLWGGAYISGVVRQEGTPAA